MADRGGSAAAGAKNWPRIGAQGRGQSTGVCFAEGVSVAGQIRSAGWSAPLGVDRRDAFQLAICRAWSSSNLTGLLYPSAECRRLAL